MSLNTVLFPHTDTFHTTKALHVAAADQRTFCHSGDTAAQCTTADPTF